MGCYPASPPGPQPSRGVAVLPHGNGAHTSGRLPPGSTTGSSPAKIISAWLAPMLVSSVGAAGSGQSGDLAKQAQADLDQWLRHIGRYGRRSGEEDLDLTLKLAVAQGFKHAANRRPAHAACQASWDARPDLVVSTAIPASCVSWRDGDR